MKIIILIFIFSISLVGVCQQDLDFQHKRVNKFIKKTYETESFKLQKITVKNQHLLYGSFFYVNNVSNDSSIVYIGRANSCRKDGCSIDNARSDGGFEYFDFIIAYNNNYKLINIKVFNYQATHGHEVTAKSWLKQFKNNSYQNLFVVNKNIDAISGATISVYSIVNQVNIVNKCVSEFALVKNK